MAEVRGRLDAGGEEAEPLDEESVAAALRRLVASGVEAITVCLLNSYANPVHEQAVARVAEGIVGDVPVFLSSDVLAEFREYERAITTTMNAYVAPEMERYLSGLRRGLDAVRAGAELQVVRSDGGLMSLDAARATPVHTMLSGPAGGVSGAAHVARLAGYDRIITFDMGGTSTDVSASLDGRPQITRETKVGPFPMRVPSVAVETIGAGGGSIASVSEVTGGLRVGPQSAGATPGPACYGNGGLEATVTDANVVLGHLPPRLLGGAMTLDVDAAHAAVARVAERLGLGVPQTAEAIVRLVDENMLGALRLVTVQRGMPADTFALVPFGGAGALHANALAATLGCFPVIVPLEPGVLSALGFLVSDVRSEFSRTFIRAVADVEPGEVAERLAALGEEAAAFLEREGVAGGRPRDPLRRGHALPPPGLRAADRDRRPGGGDAGRARRRVRRDARAALRLRPPRRSRARDPARRRHRERAVDRDAAAAAGAARRVGRAGPARTRSGTARRTATSRPTIAPGSHRAWSSTARPWSSSTTPPRVVLEGHVATVDEHANLLISPRSAA